MRKFLRFAVTDERVLLREINRRINDELAAVINLVSAGAVLAENHEVKAALSGVAELLHRYADVHRALMIPVSDVLIDAAEYLRRLGLAMSRSWLDRLQIHLVIAAHASPLESDRCWQLGLMVHELVTNAARHASFKKGEGVIRVELTRSGACLNCTVSDNGSATASRLPRHGLLIVDHLAKSFGGCIESNIGAESSSVLIAFPLTEREQRTNGAGAWRRSRVIRRFKTRNAASRPSNSARLPTPSESGSKKANPIIGEALAPVM